MLSRTYCFDDFRLDAASRELWHGDEEVPLHRKAFDCVVYLIEHRERAVERDELFQAVWGDIQLSDSVLHQTIFEARRALHDTGDEQRFIKTVRAFGYRWAAPVDLVEPSGNGEPRQASLNDATPADAVQQGAAPVEAAQAPPAAPTRLLHRPVWLAVALALLAVGALTGGTAYLSRGAGPNDSEPQANSSRNADIALLLPVIVEAEGHHTWMRLGLMDLIAERLRTAGQPVVPSDTVIALLRNRAPAPGSDDGLDRLTATTGARLVLEAHAEHRGTRWWISLTSLTGAEPPLTALGEAEDALEAAQDAADRLALALGLTPVAEPGAEPGLAMLLQQVKAARLAQQDDEARTLIEAAAPALRRRPEVRFLEARLDSSRHDLASAQAGYEALLAETVAESHPVLRASILHCLAEVHAARAQFQAATSALQEAADLLDQQPASAKLGRVHATWGKVMLHHGDLEAARVHFAHSRRTLEGTGDAEGLASLDNHLGMLEALRERYAKAVHHFESAAGQATALHELGNELGNRANLLYVHLALLDLKTASRVEQRLHELLDQVTNPMITAWSDLTRAYHLASMGRSRDAERLLSEVLHATEADEELRFWRLRALTLRAEMAARDGEATQALRAATEVVEQVPSDYTLMAEERGRAGWIAVRARLALGHRAAAADATTALADWAERGEATAPKIYAALARAELAAAENRGEAAEGAFEQALALADAGSVPLRLLRVAQSYVPWLLTEGPDGVPDPERALVVADRLAEYADRHYEAALLQLRVQHALGSSGAWRAAAAQTRSLAGEREIPAELLVEPRDDYHVASRG